MRLELTVLFQGAEDCRPDETKIEYLVHSRRRNMSAFLLSNTTTRVTPATSQGVSSTNDVLIKETSNADLARDEASPQDANEESKDYKALES